MRFIEDLQTTRHTNKEEKEEDQRNQPFVGYYSKKESQQLGEKIGSTMARVKKGLLKFGKEQGIKMGIAIIEDVANKVLVLKKR